MRVAVLGAGPVGCAAAMLLAKDGHDITVFDKGSQPSPDHRMGKQRTIIINLNARGKHALQQAGVRLPDSTCMEVGGLQMASCTSICFSDGHGNCQTHTVKLPGMVMVERDALMAHLHAEAQRLYGDRIQYCFETSITEVDLQQRTLHFTDCSGTPSSAHFDLIVGADGRNSMVRQAMQAANPRLRHVVHPSERFYISFCSLPPTEDWTLKSEKGAIWFANQCLQPVNRIAFWPTPGGTISGLFWASEAQFEGFRQKGGYADFMRRLYPQWPAAWYDAIEAQLQGARPSMGGATSKCSTIIGPGAVLIGDAACSVLPTMGQGLNTGVESALILAEVLAQCKGEVQAALQQFERQRLPDLHALFALDRTAMARVGVGFGAKWNPRCLVQTFHTKLGLMLGKYVPGCSPLPEIMRIGSERLPFRQAYWALQRDACVAILGLGMAATVGFALWQQSRLLVTGKLWCMPALSFT